MVFVKATFSLLCIILCLFMTLTLNATIMLEKYVSILGALENGQDPETTSSYNQAIKFDIDPKGATSAETAHKIYIPFKKANDTSDESKEAQTSIHNKLYVVDNHFSISLRVSPSSNIAGSGATASQNKAFYYVAIKDTNGDKQFKALDLVDSNPTPHPVEMYRTMTIPFNRFKTNTIEASELGSIDSGLNEATKSLTLYIFTADNFPQGSVPAETSGFYVKLLFSSAIQTNEAKGRPTITHVGVGDKRLSFEYSMNDSDKIYTSTNFGYSKVLLFTSASALDGYDFSDFQHKPYYKRVVSDTLAEVTDNPPEKGYGSIILKDLLNEANYYAAVAIVNNYGFVTTVSPIKEGSPVTLEMFLHDQGCFLLSASFQTNHYVLDYFRYIRDRYLLPTSLGKIFVDWYYEWAPYCAPTIIKTPWLAFAIRTLAYATYYLIHFFWYWFIPGLILFLGSLLTLAKNRRATYHI